MCTSYAFAHSESAQEMPVVWLAQRKICLWSASAYGWFSARLAHGAGERTQLFLRDAFSFGSHERKGELASDKAGIGGQGSQ